MKVGGGEEVRCGSNGQLKWTFGRISCRPVAPTGNSNGWSHCDRLSSLNLAVTLVIQLCDRE